MYHKQYNAYQDFSGGSIEQVIVIYEELLRLINESQTDKQKGWNLERSLGILVKLLSSTEDSESTEAKKKHYNLFIYLQYKTFLKSYTETAMEYIINL